ncbi:MAG: hypothetical protein HW406_2117 [Candidatus Brocadiaceae bacterium]|nr:hypothetical protein [Candidatus Brocadiaceae bacterium]
MDKLWKEAIPLKVRQADGLCLAPHHQLPHLSEHAMKHSYNTLIHVWGIHQVINPKVYTHLFVPAKELCQGSWI